MGSDLFDHAFQTYSQRWMFKHPTPEDFFRSMEDASAVDLDWFLEGLVLHYRLCGYRRGKCKHRTSDE